ncbi:MAG: hypothetical protein QOJ29_2708 [Thermoleophilaceae bacterium]|jgi:hypothetical protein|nr:hypothetical protein [Thermoleophilaceae bacterium]
MDLGKDHIDLLLSLNALEAVASTQLVTTLDLARDCQQRRLDRDERSHYLPDPPWHHLRDALEALERFGLVAIETDVALFGTNTPSTEHLYVRLTPRGRNVVAELPPI